MKVTYTGESRSVEFDSTIFVQGQPTDYDGQYAEKLRKNRYFSVEESAKSLTETETETETETGARPFPTDSKESLEAWAQENLGIERLNKQKGLKKLIAEVEAALAEKENGGNA